MDIHCIEKAFLRVVDAELYFWIARWDGGRHIYEIDAGSGLNGLVKGNMLLDDHTLL